VISHLILRCPISIPSGYKKGYKFHGRQTSVGNQPRVQIPAAQFR
jgi:hypothetical protein